MSGTTTQRYGTAAVAVARARHGAVGAHDFMANATAFGSWSIPCASPVTLHKPRPRRSQVTSS